MHSKSQASKDIFDAKKAAISYFLTESVEDQKTGVSICLGADRFLAYKGSLSDEQRSLLQAATDQFMQLSSKLDPIASDFFEFDDVVEGFSEWTKSIGFDLSACTEMDSLFKHFRLKRADDAAEDAEAEVVEVAGSSTPSEPSAHAAPAVEEAIAAPAVEEAVAAPAVEEAVAAPAVEEAVAAPAEEAVDVVMQDAASKRKRAYSDSDSDSSDSDSEVPVPKKRAKKRAKKVVVVVPVVRTAQDTAAAARRAVRARGRRRGRGLH